MFVRPLLAAGVLGLLASSSAMAGDDMAACERMFEHVMKGLIEADSTEAVEGGCRYTNVVATLDTFNRWSIGQVTLTGTDVIASIIGDRVPVAAELTFDDMVFAPYGSGGVSQYILESQQIGFKFHMAYRWDEQTGELDLNDVSVFEPRTGMAGFSAKAHLAALPDAATMYDNQTDGTITALTLRLDNRGVFESMVVPVLVSLLPYDQDPRPAIAKYQRAIAAAFAALPDTVLDTDGKAVAAEFVGVFPHPDGRYEVTFEAEEPIEVMALASIGSVTGLLKLLPSLTITAQHMPAE